MAVLAVGLCSVKASVATALQGSSKGLPNIELSFDMNGSQVKWACNAQGQRQELNGYSLDLKVEKKGSQQILRFKLQPPAGRKLSVNSYVAKISLPQKGLDSVMVPNTRILAHTLIYYGEHKVWPEKNLTRCQIPGEFGEQANANNEAPFILLTDNKGNNAFSVGWGVEDTASGLNGAPDGSNYVLTLSRKNDMPFTGDALEDALIINSSSDPWQDAEKAYAKTFDKYNARPKRKPAPAWTSKPVFCTWYCYLDNIDQEGVLKIAEKCKDLGIGTILIDAGWDATPSNGWGDWENGNLGDFIADPKRFPDLPGAVKQMHDMGLRVDLWNAPFWQGRKSHVYQEKTKDWHAWTKDGEDRNLCPRYPGTRQLFREQYARVARTYGIDGMWFDAADGVPAECIAKHEHLDQPMGQAFVDCLAAAREGLKSVNPEAITEVRVLHGNLNSKRAIDIIQPSDAPESHEMLRLAGIHLRPWAYDIVVKNDPMIWKKDADSATVGQFMATCVTNGVPALSVDFLTATDEQCAVTKAWLAFYNKNKKLLLKGQFSLFGADYKVPDYKLVGKDEAVVYMKNANTKAVELPHSVKKVYVLNCTDSDQLWLAIKMANGKRTVQTYTPDWTPLGAIGDMDESGRLKVPRGGAAVIEAQ